MSDSPPVCCQRCGDILTGDDGNSALLMLPVLHQIASRDIGALVEADLASGSVSIPIMIDEDSLPPAARNALSDAALFEGMDFYAGHGTDDPVLSSLYNADVLLEQHCTDNPSDARHLYSFLGGGERPLTGTSSDDQSGSDDTRSQLSDNEPQFDDQLSPEVVEESESHMFSSTAHLGTPLCRACLSAAVAELAIGAAAALAAQSRALDAECTAQNSRDAIFRAAVVAAAHVAGVDVPPGLCSRPLPPEQFTGAVAVTAEAQDALRKVIRRLQTDAPCMLQPAESEALRTVAARLRADVALLTDRTQDDLSAIASAAERTHQLVQEERGLTALERSSWAHISTRDLQTLDTAFTHAHISAAAAVQSARITMLAASNAFDDAFPLDIIHGVPVISGCRAGWLAGQGVPAPPINWVELSAALGEMLLLIRSLIFVTRCPLVGWELSPGASQSTVTSTVTGETAVLAADPSIFTAISSRPSMLLAVAVTGLIDCLVQLIQHLGQARLRARVTIAVHLRGAASPACDGFALEAAERGRTDTVQLARARSRPVALIDGQQLALTSAAPEALMEWTSALRMLWPLLRELIALVGHI